MRILLLVVVLVWTSFSATVFHTISGHVYDDRGVGVINAYLYINNLYSGAITDSQGYYKIGAGGQLGNVVSKIWIPNFTPDTIHLPTTLTNDTTGIDFYAKKFTFTGYVKDTNGNAVANILIYFVVSNDPDNHWYDTTDATGRYIQKNLGRGYKWKPVNPNTAHLMSTIL